jgi:hypothetical protein
MLEIVDINGAIAYTHGSVSTIPSSHSASPISPTFSSPCTHQTVLSLQNSFIPIQNVPTEKTIITDKTATAHLQWPQLLDSLDATAFSETAPIYTRTAPI